MLERHALRHTGGMALMLALLVVVWAAVRRTVAAMARSEEQDPRFEEETEPVVMELGLHRDGVLTVGPVGATPAP